MFLQFLLSLFVGLNGLVRAPQGVKLLELYAPTTGSTCPDITQNPLLREFTTDTQALHPKESEYIDTRESTVIPKAWQDWLGAGEQIGYNVSVLSSNFSRIGIAFSGGGFRAAQYSAGVTSALDARDQSAKSAGTGGLLQVASYISGLSGKSTHHLLLEGLREPLSQVARGSPDRFISTTSSPYLTLCSVTAGTTMAGFSTSTSSSQRASTSSIKKTTSSSKALSLALLQRHPPECALFLILPRSSHHNRSQRNEYN